MKTFNGMDEFLNTRFNEASHVYAICPKCNDKKLIAINEKVQKKEIVVKKCKESNFELNVTCDRCSNKYIV